MLTDSDKSQILILGAAGTGLLMAESLFAAGKYTLLGFLDDDAEKQANGFNNFPVLGGLNDWKDLPVHCLFLTSLYGLRESSQARVLWPIML
jgi:FlaA1/EpsC-like NDP-sugar epimerase